MKNVHFNTSRNVTLAFLLFLNIRHGKAQDYINLGSSAPHSGIHIYVASKYITLQPGFKYTASSGKYELAHISHIPIPNPYPIWSKRGMFVYLDGTWGDRTTGITELNNNISALGSYCQSNNITYIVIYNLMQNDPYGSSWVFYNDGTGQIQNGGELMGLIQNLKDNYGVEEIGAGYQNSTVPATSGMFKSVLTYNTGIEWDQKIDFLSLDEECQSPCNPSNCTDFSNFNNGYHLPLLREMYTTATTSNAACNGPSLRVEDYLDEPWNYNTSYCTLQGQINTISDNSDRILFPEYTEFSANLGLGYGDYEPEYEYFGEHPSTHDYRKEIWGTFSIENTDNSVGPTCGGGNFSGYDLWSLHEQKDAEYIESLFYDNTSNGVNPVFATQFNSGDDKFQIWGSMWFHYSCMGPDGENVGFNKGNNISSLGYWPYYVKVGADFQYPLSTPPANYTFTASVNQGNSTSPWTYTWYDVNDPSNTPLYTTTSNSTTSTYTINYDNTTNSYDVSKLGVLVTDGTSPVPLYATDYLCIYGKYCGGELPQEPTLTNNEGDGFFCADGPDITLWANSVGATSYNWQLNEAHPGDFYLSYTGNVPYSTNDLSANVYGEPVGVQVQGVNSCGGGPWAHFATGTGTWESCNGNSNHKPVKNDSVDIGVLPNPNKGIFIVQIDPNGTENNEPTVDIEYNVELYNPIGQLLIKENTSKKTINFDISSYSHGLYFVRITGNSKVYHKNIIFE